MEAHNKLISNQNMVPCELAESEESTSDSLELWQPSRVQSKNLGLQLILGETLDEAPGEAEIE